MRSSLRKQRGQVALETLVVIIPWLVMITIFLNGLFLLGSLMLSQATVDRGALEIGALSCLPDNVRAELQSQGSGLGMKNVQITAVTPSPAYLQTHPASAYDWNHNQFIDGDGDVIDNPTVAAPVPDCTPNAKTGTAANTVTSGNFIYLQAKYNQQLLLLVPAEMFGVSGTLTIHRSALTVSHAQEGEG